MGRRARRVSILPLPMHGVEVVHWDVISLPDNLCSVDPIHTTAKILQNYLKRLESRQEVFIKKLGSSLDVINKEIEESIRIKCKILKKDIKYLITSGHNYICYNLSSYQTDLLDFDDYKFERCKQHCSNLIRQGKAKIHEFYQFLASIEKLRCEKFHEVFTSCYDDFLNINTKSPFEVQLFFEDHILAYNQVVLSNFRNYKDIEAHLLLVFTNEVKLMLYKIFKFEESWRDLCKNEIIERLKEYTIKREEIENVLFKNESITKIIKLFNTKIETILDQITATDNTKADEWLENMKNTLNDLDTTAKQLINVYKNTADELYNKYYVESETVMEKMINKQFANITEMSEINLQYVTPPAKGTQSEEIDFHQLWKETVEFILEALYNKYIFLEELEKIFSNHTARLNKLKEIVVDNFKKLILKHDKILQGKDEASINILLDTLRRDSSKTALDNNLKRVAIIIHRIRHVIEKQKEEQLRGVKKFYDHIDAELIILKTELKIFIQKYSIEPIIVARRELNRKEYTSLYKILKDTKDYFNELGLWKDKIFENIETLIVTCKQDQQNKAEQWVSEQEEFIMINFESKLEFHKCRFERIRTDIYEVRLAELRLHEARFNSHSVEIQRGLEGLVAEESVFENENNLFASKLVDYVDSTQLDTMENLKELQITLLSLQGVIQKETIRFEEIMNKQTEYINNKIDYLYSQNLLFLKSMKLFHEGGNFSTAEVKIITKKIRQLNTSIKKKSVSLNTGLQNFKIKIDEQLIHVRVSFEEKQKYGKIFFDFKVDAGNIFRVVQTGIKNVVIETKTVKNKTHMLYDRVMKLLQLRSNPYAFLNYLINDCVELNERFSLHKEHLEDFSNAPKLKPLPVKESSVSAKKSVISISQSKSTATIKTDTHKLFDTEIDMHHKEDKFLSNIRKILIVNTHELEKKAKRFYNTVKKEDCMRFNISHTVRTFMGGVFHKFTYYYLQCLQIWIIEIRDFINMIHNLRNELELFCEKYLKQAYELQAERLEKKANKYILNMKQTLGASLTNIKYNTGLLKPLYGYPGNHKMLHDLNAKVTKMFKDAKEEFNNIIVKPKKFIENALNNYMEVITKEKNKIEELYVLIPDKSKYENLVTQVKNIMFSTNFDNFVMPIQCTEIIDNSEIDIGNINEIMGKAEPVRTPPSQLTEILLQNFAEILSDKIDKLYEIENEFTSTFTILKASWTENVDKVVDLYKIKHC